MVYKIDNQTDTIKKILDALNVGQYTGLKNHIGLAGNFAVRTGKDLAHRITGHMQRNIQIQTVGDMEVNVLSKAIYSGWENARGPDHDFFEQMHQKTIAGFGGSVAIGEIQKQVRAKVQSSAGLSPG